MIAWTNKEVELIVADYFSMLSKELTGQNYTKSVHSKKSGAVIKQSFRGFHRI